MNAVVEQAAEPAAQSLIPANQAPTLLAYLRAVESGADLDRLEKLMDLHERYEKSLAEKAFGLAMSKFRAEEMVILKSKFVNIPNGAKFWHAQLADVCSAVTGKMSKYGLRHRWKTNQTIDHATKGVIITVTCIISHELGFSEETTLFGPPDTAGNKSVIHAIASTVALLERYTLLAGVGLAAREMDNNPTGTGTQDPPSTEGMPADYDRWRADTKAIAEEGNERFYGHWRKTPEDIRRWASTKDVSWFADMKALARKSTQRAGVTT